MVEIIAEKHDKGKRMKIIEDSFRDMWDNIKHKERILEAAREKQQVTYKGKPTQFAVDLSTETLRPEGNGRIYLKYWKKKIYNQYYFTQQKSHSKSMEKSKSSQTSKI